MIIALIIISIVIECEIGYIWLELKKESKIRRDANAKLNIRIGETNKRLNDTKGLANKLSYKLDKKGHNKRTNKMKVFQNTIQNIDNEIREIMKGGNSDLSV